MKVSEVSIESVIPYARNPRKNDGAAVDKVAASLQEFGWQQAIVVDKDMVIIAGHTRFKAAKKLGMKKVPIKVAEGLTPEQVKAYRLADNRSHEEAEWDKAMLALELQELSSLDYELENTAFDDSEIADLLHSLDEPEGDPEDCPELQELTVSKTGDLWFLGNHVLYCGDSLDPESYVKIFPHNTKCDLVFTDPPYNVDYVGKTKKALKIKNDSLGNDFRQFLTQILINARETAKKGAGIYVCMSDTEAHTLASAMLDAGWMVKQWIVWIKDSFVMGRKDYHTQHEPILYGWQAGEAHSWYGGRNKSTVWNFARPKRNEQHPTMKPVELVEHAILNSSKAGDDVLDPFMGSGTTLIACEKTGRSARGIEIDPRYVDVIIRRWQEYTGKEAVYGFTKKTFKEIDHDRSGRPASEKPSRKGGKGKGIKGTEESAA